MDLNVRNILLATIGSLAVTYEKAVETLDELVRKGELTISEAKELNEELKKKMKTPADERRKDDDAPLTARQLKEILAEMNLATKADLEALGEKISQLVEQKT
ncbi:MAG: hypothetical protein IMF26_04030 [Candidatus Fermentithermobacillus carboniphilus]|uniref:Polyhydroxyalkanoate synthesis regulator phasin n=1 Tax=Candidatus Fermentithermobacillus carboniphilus TaxID=3085328 RepID=A0AAT9LG75_9FIRM|nr:MAG: hypothetical protein IMF26_04030 [Candidatus Fermentithermobacillus carboniphilus]